MRPDHGRHGQRREDHLRLHHRLESDRRAGSDRHDGAPTHSSFEAGPGRGVRSAGWVLIESWLGAAAQLTAPRPRTSTVRRRRRASCRRPSRSGIAPALPARRRPASGGPPKPDSRVAAPAVWRPDRAYPPDRPGSGCRSPAPAAGRYPPGPGARSSLQMDTKLFRSGNCCAKCRMRGIGSALWVAVMQDGFTSGFMNASSVSPISNRVSSPMIPATTTRLGSRFQVPDELGVNPGMVQKPRALLGNAGTVDAGGPRHRPAIAGPAELGATEVRQRAERARQRLVRREKHAAVESRAVVFVAEDDDPEIGVLSQKARVLDHRAVERPPQGLEVLLEPQPSGPTCAIQANVSANAPV